MSNEKMDLFKLFEQKLCMSPIEAQHYLRFEETETEHVMYIITNIEVTTFKGICKLVEEQGGFYDRESKPKSFHIPKEKTAESVPNPDINNYGIHPEPNKETVIVGGHFNETAEQKPRYAPNFTMVPTASLAFMTFKSRITPDFDINELVESIREHGVLEPILVRPKADGGFECVAGERRVNAARLAGLAEVPAYVRSLSDVEAIVIQLTENLQRRDLTETEKSTVLANLKKATGWKVKEIAEKLKKSEKWVYTYLPAEFKNKEMAELGREDRDEQLRDLLRKRHGVTVVSVPYSADTEQERSRVFALIKEETKP